MKDSELISLINDRVFFVIANGDGLTPNAF